MRPLQAAQCNAGPAPALLRRLHPALSRIERLSRETPAWFIAFDVLARGDEDLRGLPFAERRQQLERLFRGARAPLVLTPITADVQGAERWLHAGRGIDGVVAKDPCVAYRPGERALVKVKHERTADCHGELRHVGLASSFAEATRPRLLETLSPLAIPLEQHPWENGFLLDGSPMGRMKGAAAKWTPEMGLDWIPVAPSLVCEVAYDHIDGDRFRHPARFHRFRPDREPRSCTFEQFQTESPAITALAA